MRITWLLNSIPLSPSPTPCTPFSLPPRTTPLFPHPNDVHCQVRQALFILYYDIWVQDGIWTVSSHPSPTSQLGPGNVPYVPLVTHRPLPQATATQHLRLPSTILDSDSDYKKNGGKNTPLSLNRIPGLPITIYQPKNVFSNTPTWIRAPNPRVRSWRGVRT